MIRASTLLPAFILAFGLAGASLAMAADSNSSNAKQAQSSESHPLQGHPAKAADTSCNNAPMYERPYYCQAHGG